MQIQRQKSRQRSRLGCRHKYRYRDNPLCMYTSPIKETIFCKRDLYIYVYKEPYKRDDILQKRLIILSIVLYILSIVQRQPTVYIYTLTKMQIWGATVSTIYKIISVFCRISSLLQGSFANETYNLIDPSNQSHPIEIQRRSTMCIHIFIYSYVQIHTHSLSHAHTRTHSLSLSLTRAHALSLTHAHTNFVFLSFKHIHTHTHTHTCTHTHAHTRTLDIVQHILAVSEDQEWLYVQIVVAR